MPILATDQFGSGTLYTMTPADTFAFLKRDVAYVSTNGPAMVIGSTINGNATLTIAGMVESGGAAAVAISGLATNFLRRTLNVREGGSVASRNTAVTVTDSDFNLTNDGLITSQSETISVNTTGGLVGYFVNIVNNGTISSGSGVALSLLAGFVSVVNTGQINGSIRALNRLIFVNTGEVVGSVTGSPSGDTFDTYAGTVTGSLTGGLGGDLYVIRGTERLIEAVGGGTDTVRSHGNYRLAQNLENLELLGAATVGYGNALNNVLTGNDQGNSLFGGGGNDIIRGGTSDDVLNGGIGDDFLALSAGTDSLIGGTGTDTLLIDTTGTYVVDLTRGTVTGTGTDGMRLSGIENVTITVGFGNDTIIGSSADNRLDAGDGNDSVSGAGGSDTLIGGQGNDRFDGGEGIDTVIFVNTLTSAPVTASLLTGTATGSTQGTDTIVDVENLIGTFDNDILQGNQLTNVLDGSNGNDTLSGLGGTDVLIGGFGDDTLTGGGASDTFVFDAVVPSSSGTDTITDFQNGLDTISFVGGAVAVTSFAELSFATPGDGSVVITSADGTIVLQNFAVANLDASDFIFDSAALAAVGPAEATAYAASAWGQMAVAIP